MYEFLKQLLTVSGVLLAFWMGYRAGKREETVMAKHIPPMDIADIEESEEVAPKSEDEIREDMKMSRTIMQGYDWD